MIRSAGFVALLLPALSKLLAQTPDQVLVVVNKQSAASREIGDYYIQKRGIPLSNRCMVDVAPDESVSRPDYETRIEAPIASFLKSHGLREKILYIVLTTGVPLRIPATENGSKPDSDGSAVDSELTLLYRRMRGEKLPLAGPIPNPFFGQRDTPFRHPLFPVYLVNRLDAYTMADMKALVDRALVAHNTGKFVIDLRADDSTPGNQWLSNAALLLPKDRVIMDSTAAVLAGIHDVIAYASWGSNDHDHKHRLLHNQWLPGAIATEFVSTDGRTFRPPPAIWELGTWADQKSWYAGAPQSLTADYIHEGASGASGQVDEPYLAYCPRPDFVLPAYYSGRNLAESFYMGIPGLSWMNVVIGDPLMRLH
jgi:uncharacterized protein (TIGR03790 family)